LTQEQLQEALVSISEVQEEVDAGTASNDLVESADQLFKVIAQTLNTPEGREEARKIQQSKISGEIAEKVGKGFQIALGTADVATALNQISRSEAELDSQVKPSRPRFRRSAKLKQALDDSMDINRGVQQTVQPVIDDVRLAAAQGADQARVLSGGQASQAAALNQQNLNNRFRNLSTTVPGLINTLRQQNIANRDRLLQSQVRENVSNAIFDQRLFGDELAQFNAEQSAAGQLGAAGRQNLRFALRNLAVPVAGTLGNRLALEPSRTATDRLVDQVNSLVGRLPQNEASGELEAFERDVNGQLIDAFDPFVPQFIQ